MVWGFQIKLVDGEGGGLRLEKGRWTPAGDRVNVSQALPCLQRRPRGQQAHPPAGEAAFEAPGGAGEGGGGAVSRWTDTPVPEATVN